VLYANERALGDMTFTASVRLEVLTELVAKLAGIPLTELYTLYDRRAKERAALEAQLRQQQLEAHRKAVLDAEEAKLRQLTADEPRVFSGMPANLAGGDDATTDNGAATPGATDTE